MIDVFISYSRDDLQRAELIEAELKQLGYNVWRDDRIRAAGAPWPNQIRDAIQAARCVLVLWSHSSIRDSHWVREEAHAALDQGKLLQLRIDDIEKIAVWLHNYSGS